MLNTHAAPALHTVLHSFPLKKAQAQHRCHVFIPAQHHSFTCSVLHQHPMQRAGRLGSEGGQDNAGSLTRVTPQTTAVSRVFSYLICDLCYCVHIPSLT